MITRLLLVVCCGATLASTVSAQLPSYLFLPPEFRCPLPAPGTDSSWDNKVDLVKDAALDYLGSQPLYTDAVHLEKIIPFLCWYASYDPNGPNLDDTGLPAGLLKPGSHGLNGYADVPGGTGIYLTKEVWCLESPEDGLGGGGGSGGGGGFDPTFGKQHSVGVFRHECHHISLGFTAPFIHKDPNKVPGPSIPGMNALIACGKYNHALIYMADVRELLDGLQLVSPKPSALSGEGLLGTLVILKFLNMYKDRALIDLKAAEESFFGMVFNQLNSSTDPEVQVLKQDILNGSLTLNNLPPNSPSDPDSRTLIVSVLENLAILKGQRNELERLCFLIDNVVVGC